MLIEILMQIVLIRVILHSSQIFWICMLESTFLPAWY